MKCGGRVCPIRRLLSINLAGKDKLFQIYIVVTISKILIDEIKYYG